MQGSFTCFDRYFSCQDPQARADFIDGNTSQNPSYLTICLLWLKAITALKKGAQLLKYGRRGKPKFCPFKLSNVSNYCMSYHVTYLHGFSWLYISCSSRLVISWLQSWLLNFLLIFLALIALDSDSRANSRLQRAAWVSIQSITYWGLLSFWCPQSF